MADVTIPTTLDAGAAPTLLRRSPLAGTARQLMDSSITGARDVRIAECAFTTMVSVRVPPTSASASAIGDVLGTALSARVGEVAAHGPHRVLWLGPDEWLIVSETSAELLLPALREAVGEETAALVDVSANRTILEVTGAAARSVLEKGCPTDLHPRAFGPGRAVTTTLARVPLILWQVGPSSYRLLPRSSYAEYIAAWLLDAIQEFGQPLGQTATVAVDGDGGS